MSVNARSEVESPALTSVVVEVLRVAFCSNEATEWSLSPVDDDGVEGVEGVDGADDVAPLNDMLAGIFISFGLSFADDVPGNETLVKSKLMSGALPGVRADAVLGSGAESIRCSFGAQFSPILIE